MENTGVDCDVAGCIHHASKDKCELPTIKVTHQCTGPTDCNDPHYCKSYQSK